MTRPAPISPRPSLAALALAALTFAGLGLAAGACRSAPDAPPAAGTENPDVTTPAEVPTAVGTTPDDGPPGEPGGEPGAPGTPRPEATYRIGDGECYVYEAYVVAVRSRADTAGQDVVAVRRGDGDARAQCTAPAEGAAAALTDPASPDFFFGLAGDLMLVDTGTGPNGRTLRLIDLATGQTVHATDYEEPVEVRDSVLTYNEPVDDFATMEGLAATGVNCPQAEEWFENELGVGVNRVVRYDLAARQARPTDELTCVPLQ